VLRSSLGEDIDAEVSLVNLIVVLLLVLLRHGLALALQTVERLLQILLLLHQPVLNNFRPRQKSLLQILQSLVLHVNSCLFIQLLLTLVFQTQFLENRQQIVLGSFLLVLLSHLRLPLLHFVSRFLINSFLEDFSKDIFRVGLLPLLLDALLKVPPLSPLRVGVFLVTLDLGVALLLHVADSLEELQLLQILLVLLSILLVHVPHLALRNQIHSVDFVRLFEDLALLVVVVDQHLVLGNVEFSLTDLLRCWLGGV
jgi:hypothetical protein